MQICVRAHDLKVKGSAEIIKSLISANADGMQLVCCKSFDAIDKISGGITDAQASFIGKSMKDANLSIALIGAYFNPVHSDKLEVERGIEVFCDYLRICKRIGCNVIGTETGSCNDEPWIYHPKNRTDESLIKTTDVFRKLCDYAAKHDAIVGIEGAAGHVCYDIKTLDKATRIIGRENLKIIFDYYNFMDAEHSNYLDILAEGIATFKGKIHCFHIKDGIFRGNTLKQCAVGNGDFDFDSILSQIKQYDENAVLILEGTVGEDIPGSVAFMREKWMNA